MRRKGHGTSFRKMTPAEIKKNISMLGRNIASIHKEGELKNPIQQTEEYVQRLTERDDMGIYALFDTTKKKNEILAFATAHIQKVGVGKSTRGQARPEGDCYYLMYVKAVKPRQGYGSKVMEQTLSEINKWTVAKTTEVCDIKGVFPGSIYLNAREEIQPFYGRLGFCKSTGTTMILNAKP